MTLSARRFDQPAAFGRVALLHGGDAAEREISLISGRFVAAALQRLGIDFVAIDPADGDLPTQLREAAVDRALVILHGPGGEDGTVQGALDLMGIPYAGSGVLGSALAMDKVRTKQIWQAVGIPTPDFASVRVGDDLSPVLERLGLPLFVKPSHEGSSLGMSRVDRAEDLAAAVAAAGELDGEVLVEALIDGPEYTVSVLDGVALPSIRIDTPNEFYDYEAKYFTDTTTYLCPSDLEPEVEVEAARLALDAFAAIGGEGWGRVDLMRDAQGRLWFLEVNTVPGMTDHSLVPMAAKAAGADYDELVWRILETSFGGAA
jgi:D-alanine-D-alanine ligase